MLTSVAEHRELIRQEAVDVIQPDAPPGLGVTLSEKMRGGTVDRADIEGAVP